MLTRDLSAAATAGDDARVRALLAELLRCKARRTEERLRLQLQALEDLFQTMRAMAMTDELTGLNNRRGFFRAGARLLEFADRVRWHALIVHADVDHLKRVNDVDGHFAGDLLLRQAADALRRAFPHHDVYDVIGRLGGDEFAVLSLSQQYIEPEAVRMRIAKIVGSSNSAGRAPALSISVGVTRVERHGSHTIADLLETAERAMYADKAEKNRIAPVHALPVSGGGMS